MSLQTCLSCKTSVNVPDDRGQITVKCRCGWSWFHPPVDEISDIEFKCSVTRRPFVVRFSRNNPNKTFKITGCAALEDGPEAGDRPRITGGLQKLLQMRDQLRPGHGGDAVSLAPGMKRWLIDLAARGLVSLSSDQTLQTKSELDSELIVRDANEYSWWDFECPCCASDRAVGRCSRCGFFGCQGTVEEKADGRHWRCACGRATVLGTGGVATIEERRRAKQPTWVAEDLPRLPPPETRRLPAPQRMLPAPSPLNRPR